MGMAIIPKIDPSKKSGMVKLHLEASGDALAIWCQKVAQLAGDPATSFETLGSGLRVQRSKLLAHACAEAMPRWIFACEHDMKLDSWKACDLCFSEEILKRSQEYVMNKLIHSTAQTSHQDGVSPGGGGKKNHAMTCPDCPQASFIFHCCQLLALAVSGGSLLSVHYCLLSFLVIICSSLKEGKNSFGQSLYMLIPCLRELSKRLTKIHWNPVFSSSNLEIRHSAFQKSLWPMIPMVLKWATWATWASMRQIWNCPQSVGSAQVSILKWQSVTESDRKWWSRL